MHALSQGARHEGGKGSQRRQGEGRQKGQNSRERRRVSSRLTSTRPSIPPRIPVHYRPYRISPVHCVYCGGLTIALAWSFGPADRALDSESLRNTDRIKIQLYVYFHHYFNFYFQDINLLELNNNYLIITSSVRLYT